VDTRKKIVTPEDAVAVAERLRAGGTALKVVSGYFDPLLAEHSRRLGRARDEDGALMAVISSPADPILNAGARAELVAALGVVDYVVLPGNTTVEELLARLPVAEIIRLERADEETTRELIRHVHNRQEPG